MLDIEVSPVPIEVSNRQRREANTKIPEELLVVQEIKISDKFGFNGLKKGQSKKGDASRGGESSGVS